MNGYNFTERVRKTLAMSREEAARLGHPSVGTEHMLLGMLRNEEGVAATVLESLAVDVDDLRRRVEATVVTRAPTEPTTPDLPYTSRAKKVLELAMAEARDLHHQYVGTEHLLLGLIVEEKGIAAQVLRDAGLTLERVREEVVRILGDSRVGSHGEPHSGPSATPGRRPRDFAVAMSLPRISIEIQHGHVPPVRFECHTVAQAIAFLEKQ